MGIDKALREIEVYNISGTTMYILDDNGKLFFAHTEEEEEIKS